MPLYDFQCEQCGKEFEVERSMTETRKEACPFCGSKKTVKVFSSAGISFRGSGFYVTDSKPSSSKPSGSEPSSNGSSKPAAPSPSDSDSSSD